MGPQSCAVSLEDSLANTKTSQQGGPVGLVMAMLFLVGGAFALILPLVSLVAFLLSGLLGREKRKRSREQEARVV